MLTNFTLFKTITFVSLLSILTACNSDLEEKPEPLEPDPDKPIIHADSIMRTKSASAQQCLNGGIHIEMGIDKNDNGQLDDNEIDDSRTKTLCHGVDGQVGEDGLQALIAIKDATDDLCINGGKQLSIGLDTNRNDRLDQDEVTQVDVLCNQVVEQPSALQSLIKTTDIQSGEVCPTGGVKIESGIDADNDGELSPNEIQNVNVLCNGLNGAHGGDLSNLLIQTIAEPIGVNCLQGGNKILIGLDADLDAELQADEVISASYACYPNTAPEINVYGDEVGIKNSEFSINISTYDEDYDPDVTLSIIDKPDWLSVEFIDPMNAQLTGQVPDTSDQTFTVVASATDTDLTETVDVTFSLVDGVVISAQADDVLEGNEGLQDAHFTVTLSKAASAPLSIEWQLDDNDYNYFYDQGWQAENVEGRLTFEVGETEKTIPLQILGDERIELNEHVFLHLDLSEEYTGSEVIHVKSKNTLFIMNDDSAVFEAGNFHAINVMYTPDRYSEWSDFDISNVPEWMEVETQYGGYYHQLSMEGEPPLADTNTTGTVELTIDQKNFTIDYRVTESDQDNDGAIDSEDAFPTNPRGITDSDNDGVGDEWELTYFEDLTAVTDETDYDQNGLTDWYAFENGTPVNDLSVDFESGQLPVGWSNSGHVNWVKRFKQYG